MKRGEPLDKGLIQIYCGNGKGKTTAAIGQGIRAVGQGLKVIMIQFLKSTSTGEVIALKQLEPHFKVFCFEKERDFFWNLKEDQKKELQNEIYNGMNFAKKVLDVRECDILILDEILGVLENQLVDEEEILTLIEHKPEDMELILTGRTITSCIAEKSHYISTIECTKHPFEQGIEARKGIEY
ncbi:MAG: cob(I)yrinic acid a,c-diamide adenosyltransferase [Epulopiscium sp.]|nr:cob(I)yrinic acid a,c-diamide adenosyltransferase [Candidatus Epulonipiscium sp.]